MEVREHHDAQALQRAVTAMARPSRSSSTGLVPPVQWLPMHQQVLPAAAQRNLFRPAHAGDVGGDLDLVMLRSVFPVRGAPRTC